MVRSGLWLPLVAVVIVGQPGVLALASGIGLDALASKDRLSTQRAGPLLPNVERLVLVQTGRED